MASETSHIDQWKHNRSLISQIPHSHPDWIVTVAFYTALHAVDAMLARAGIEVRCHDDRNETLQKTHTYSHIWLKYSVLHNLARKIRYFADPKLWVPFEKVRGQVIACYLLPIEKSVQSQMKIQLDLPDIALAATKSAA